MSDRSESRSSRDSQNPLADESEDRDPSSGEPEVWKGRYDDNGEVARGGVGGTALVPEADLKNPFEENDRTDGDAAERP